jgi:UDP-N-acetylglucosamine 2-epimerase (non-hydrolysing)
MFCETPPIRTVLFVFGTRPEAIKLAPVITALNKRSDLFKVVVCVTGQHRQMLDQVLSLFQIVPDYDLDIMRHDQGLFDVTCSILSGLKTVLGEVCPDIVLVQGDTTTSMVASIASFYRQTSVGHIEAGLRTNNKYSPFPEEINRKITGVIADYHFAPTARAYDNLIREGVTKESVFITGNTVIDALQYTVKIIESDKTLNNQLHLKFSFLAPEKKVILVTGHRRENIGDNFEAICEALVLLAKRRDDIEIVFPVHLNPNVQRTAQEILGAKKLSNVHLIDPLDYLSFVYIMKYSHIVLSDSGGIQEEAPALGKPVLITRETTERPEAVDSGCAKLVGANRDMILTEIIHLLDDTDYYRSMSQAVSPFGDGRAADRIAAVLSGTAFPPFH